MAKRGRKTPLTAEEKAALAEYRRQRKLQKSLNLTLWDATTMELLKPVERRQKVTTDA